MVKVVNAIVKFPARDCVTRYGERSNFVAVTETGVEARVWGPMQHPAFQRLRVGERISLTVDSRGNYRLVEDTPVAPQPVQPSQAQAVPSASDTAGIHTEVVGWLGEQSQLLKLCYEQVSKAFQGTLDDPDQLRPLAVTLYLQSQRQFPVSGESRARVTV